MYQLIKKMLRWVRPRRKSAKTIYKLNRLFDFEISDLAFNFNCSITPKVFDFIKKEISIDIDTLVIVNSLCVDFAPNGDPNRHKGESDVCIEVLEKDGKHICFLYIGETLEEF